MAIGGGGGVGGGGDGGGGACIYFIVLLSLVFREQFVRRSRGCGQGRGDDGLNAPVPPTSFGAAAPFQAAVRPCGGFVFLVFDQLPLSATCRVSFFFFWRCQLISSRVPTDVYFFVVDLAGRTDCVGSRRCLHMLWLEE